MQQEVHQHLNMSRFIASCIAMNKKVYNEMSCITHNYFVESSS